MKRFCVLLVLIPFVWTAACGSEKSEEEQAIEKLGELAQKMKEAFKPKPKVDYTEADEEGQMRIVNFLDHAVDVWAAKHYKYNGKLLAENVATGSASKWFAAAPSGMLMKVVKAGSGAEGEKLTGLFGPKKKKGQWVTVPVYKNSKGKVASSTKYERGYKYAPAAPAAGKAVAWLHGQEIRDEKKKALAFYVGDSKGTCLNDRKNVGKNVKLLLSGVGSLEYVVATGKSVLTLHARSDNKCATPLHTIQMDIPAGEGKHVFLTSADGKTLKELQLDLKFK